MEVEGRTSDRRTVLRTMGAAMGATAFAAGPATAEVGDCGGTNTTHECREVTSDAPLYHEDDTASGCRVGDFRTTVVAGTRGKLYCWCGSYGAFSSNDDYDYTGYVHESYLEKCC